jgi:hypothetical protein
MRGSMYSHLSYLGTSGEGRGVSGSTGGIGSGFGGGIGDGGKGTGGGGGTGDGGSGSGCGAGTGGTGGMGCGGKGSTTASERARSADMVVIDWMRTVNPMIHPVIHFSSRGSNLSHIALPLIATDKRFWVPAANCATIKTPPLSQNTGFTTALLFRGKVAGSQERAGHPIKTSRASPFLS